MSAFGESRLLGVLFLLLFLLLGVLFLAVLTDLARQQTVNSVTVPNSYAELRQAVAPPFRFVASASDSDGNTLNFAINNRSGWADFDPTTGALYGTPGAADVGHYCAIQIAASDGLCTQAWQVSL